MSDFLYGRQIHPVEYIEAENGGGSTLVQYAVGNYRLTDTTDWEITFSAEAPGNNWVLGQPTWIGVHYRKDTTTGNLPRVGITNGAAAANQCYVDYTNNEKITLALKGTDVYANGVKAGSITRVSAPATQTKYGIFAYKDINQALPNLRIQSARIYRLKIWDNDVLVQDLIPVIDENGVGGFFENVSRTFIEKESNSTSEFQYPAREVEYLESTGTQYIDTGYKPVPATTKFEFYFSPTTISGNYFLFGARPDTSIGGFTCTTYFATGNIRQDWAGLGSYFTKINVGDKVLYSAYNNTVSLNNDSATGTITRSTDRLNYNFLLFTVNTGGTVDSRMYVGKVYYAKLWDNGTLVRDFIPCYKDGVACMIDKLTGTAYLNQGTGAFTVGRIVEPEYE